MKKKIIVDLWDLRIIENLLEYGDIDEALGILRLIMEK